MTGPLRPRSSLAGTPHISVVIPALQEGKLLARTLEQFSHDLRTAHGLEVIVSDGGSTDDTLSIARRLADAVVECPPGERQNISIGRNRGARAARGALLLFINADTWIDDVDSFLSRMRDEAGRDGVSAITCSVCVHREEERGPDRLFHAMYNAYFRFLNTAGLGMGRGECQLVRRETFERLGGYDERIAAGEDFDLFVRLRRKGRVLFLPSLVVRESARRYRKYGYLWISFLWFVNAVSVLFFRRSIASRWKPVR